MKKVAFVTASTMGIGFAIIKKLAQQGYTTYMGYYLEDEAKLAQEKLAKDGLTTNPIFNDARKKETYEEAIKYIESVEGRLDVLVNNFGTSNPREDLDIINTSYESFIKTVDINLASVFLTSQAAIKVMKNNGGGSIINIASIGGILPDVARIGYAVSKSAIITLTKNMALQLGSYNIRVNSVCPGQTATAAVMNNLSTDFQNLLNRHTPLGRMAQPEEIAEAVAYFAGDGATYTTGQILAVAGGFGLGTPIYADLASMKAEDRH